MQPTPESYGLGVDVAVMALIVALVLICVGVHYEMLRASTWAIRRVRVRPRLRITFGVLGGIVGHGAEILVFALGYAVAMAAGLGGFEPQADVRDVIYFSSVSFTTLGYGDIVPVGPLRLLAGVEALTGLVLITWTASFTYLQMARFWSDR